ncbi:hypothetical protein WJX84_000385 [Apatococcus fuscideae]|uniref:Uncharacterized protein n=1 Tax=Apatococcus fuscideae TaxID=2026836 RepID=A0AAW1SM84_9CHLO
MHRPHKDPSKKNSENLELEHQKEQIEAQREWEQEMWEANERAEAEKATQQKQQKAEDQHKAQESLQKEDSWFLLGATNERWIPPERRLRPMSDYRQAERTHPSPYEWDAQPLHNLKTKRHFHAAPAPLQPAEAGPEQQPSLQTTAPTGPAGTTAAVKEYPWTWHAN